jgi:hypothetical protein
MALHTLVNSLHFNQLSRLTTVSAMAGQILPQQAVLSLLLLLDLKSKQSGGTLSPVDQMMSLIRVTRYG